MPHKGSRRRRRMAPLPLAMEYRSMQIAQLRVPPERAASAALPERTPRARQAAGSVPLGNHHASSECDRARLLLLGLCGTTLAAPAMLWPFFQLTDQFPYV